MRAALVSGGCWLWLARCALIWTVAQGSVLAAPGAVRPTVEIDLQVDMRMPAQRIYRISERIAVTAGALTLHYPKWIPGEHSPSGPLEALSGLIIRSDKGERLDWQRDPGEPFDFKVQVPRGVRALRVEMQLLSPSSGGEFGHIVWASDRVQALEWNQVVLYPGSNADAVVIRPQVSVPAGWQCATALRAARAREGDSLAFEAVTLTELVDSPIVCGLHAARFDLAPGATAPVALNLIAQEPESLALSDDDLATYRRMVNEVDALFGGRHYERYEFLLTLSEGLGSFGLEHAQSSDDRAQSDFLSNLDLRAARGFLLPHELIHSWNGKYRRPEGLAMRSFNAPLRGELLWVYEGLTTYLGEVVSARSGLWSQAQFRDSLALAGAAAEHQAGRGWRNLQDTADAGPVIYYSPDEWSTQRRGTDFYKEGALIWLEVDAQLRKLSHGTRSIESFARAFFGSEPGAVTVRPYRFEDIVRALNAVQPHDWTRFFRERLLSHERAPLGGIEQSGWRLVYRDEASAGWLATERIRNEIDLSYSVGLRLAFSATGTARIVDVVWDSPAFRAGLAPAMELVGIDGRVLSPERIRSAIKLSPSRTDPLRFIVRNGDRLETIDVDYRAGARYPHLERGAGEDVLTTILQPLIAGARSEARAGEVGDLRAHFIESGLDRAEARGGQRR